MENWELLQKYPFTAETAKELDQRFAYHPGTEEQGERCAAIRQKVRDLADIIVCLTPVCREQSLALTHLEDALQYAIAAIVRRE